MAPAGGGNIKVVVRVRPFNGRGRFHDGGRCGSLEATARLALED
jgi:hypothetical protein